MSTYENGPLDLEETLENFLCYAFLRDQQTEAEK
jgi:hypothetical protein